MDVFQLKGWDVHGNQFDLQIAAGGTGAFNNCAGKEGSMFPGGCWEGKGWNVRMLDGPTKICVATYIVVIWLTLTWSKSQTWKCLKFFFLVEIQSLMSISSM